MQEGNETINDALNPVADASSGWSFDMSTIWDKLIEYGTSLIFAVAILVIGFMITKKITKMFSKMLKKKEFDASLSGFLISMVSVILKVFRPIRN